MNAAPAAVIPVRKSPKIRLRPLDGDASGVRGRVEAFVPITLLLAQIIFVPLTSPHFPIAAIILSAAVAIYVVLGLILLNDSNRRWQLTPPWWNDGKDYAYGAVAILMVFVAGIGPILALRYFETAMPNPGSPWIYLGWCLVQDFVFFSLILRGLADLINPYIAIVITGVLFGLSHFPNVELMVGTLIIATAWGYLFLASRWLLFVLVSHWLMGFLLLSR